MIFIQINNEPIVQVDDKTRVDLSKTFTSGGTPIIESYSIELEVGGGFIPLADDMIMDWAYATSGEKTITVKAIDEDANEYTKTSVIKVVTAEEDNLFSVDADIVPYEPDILSYVEDGRSSFIDKHRAAQAKILNDLDSARIWKDDGERYVASDIIDTQEFHSWSKFQALRIIFEGLSNTSDDVFTSKAFKYLGLADRAKNRATLRLDSDSDGKISKEEKVDNFSGNLVRR